VTGPHELDGQPELVGSSGLPCTILWDDSFDRITVSAICRGDGGGSISTGALCDFILLGGVSSTRDRES